jgi:hypothetical protein
LINNRFYIHRENTYVAVFGTLKVHNKARYVAATKLKPITDYNEISANIGRVVYDHLYFTKNMVSI